MCTNKQDTDLALAVAPSEGGQLKTDDIQIELAQMSFIISIQNNFQFRFAICLLSVECWRSLFDIGILDWNLKI